MSDSDCDRPVAVDVPSDAGAAVQQRIDSAHATGRKKPETSSVPQLAVVGAGDSSSAVAQLRTQASQLANYLRSRQRDIDRRESQLNARIAQWEGDSRLMRLSLSEREEQLAEKERQVEACLARLASVEAAACRDHPDYGEPTVRSEQVPRDSAQEIERRYHQRSVELDRREAAIRRREEALREREEEIESLNGLTRDEIDAELIRRNRVLRERKGMLDEAEASLADARAEVEELREQLLEDRRKAQEQARTERQRMAAAHRSALAELEEKRRSLTRRGEHVDRTHAALGRLRTELGRTYREILEIRLATHQMWTQLAGAAPPAALSHSFEQIRAKLADHYRLANADLTEKKQQLEAIRGQLTDQYDRVVRKKRELQRWAARRREAIERKTRHLFQQEREIKRQEALFNDLAQQWRSEQLGYQQEIRRLKARLEDSQPVALVAS